MSQELLTREPLNGLVAEVTLIISVGWGGGCHLWPLEQRAGCLEIHNCLRADYDISLGAEGQIMLQRGPCQGDSNVLFYSVSLVNVIK